ncbi:sensor histidine kinase N-terminal domain-containing protein [Azovibrio restrictus]|uniref:sensor histidine kinase N-terminal domain-containing protein n=1 Tax=Azovibrio restrictus TaxID=146938 RepID=UPI0026EC88B4|nr:sensor histidine kinase N-terminal domain-containing protein [Azovibrio restrictus]MDD3484640.1 sensor histidine kinase N-terminal domain-containing protein [Azovibrio restrictus]
MKSPPKTRRTGDSQRSLFGEILDWMLAPLLFVWPISIALTHYFANNVAAFPYDQALRGHVSAISRQLKFVGGKPAINLPGSARAVIRADEIDTVYFHVYTRQGRLLAGDKDFPPPADLGSAIAEPGEIYFRDDELNGQELRVAYSFLNDAGMAPEQWVLVEVGETLEKRAQLANKIIASVIIPQFIIIPLAVVLVWFGLTKGLQPLTRLRETIEARQSADLSPISNRRVPEELEPLIGAFNAMLERMKRNVDAQQRFIADAAHQMRTPLAGLKTQAQLAQRESNPRQLQNSLRQIATGVDRASRLVNQLLTLVRTEAGDQLHQKQEPLDLDQLLRETVEDWVMRAMERRIDLGFETSGPAIIRGNAFLLREMVNNLIDNALRYTPGGGQVTARVVGHGDFAILEVEDSGIGISEEQAELVFERFYRVDDAGTEGSGLGLAIVREIADQHRAAASLGPNPRGKGAIARVIFPAWYDSTAVGQEVKPV